MISVRTVAVLVAAMWFSTAMAAGQGGMVWNSPDAPPETVHAGMQGGHAHAHAATGHHAAHGDRGHGGKSAIHAKSKGVAAASAVKQAVKHGRAHAPSGAGVRRVSAAHGDPRSHKAHSPASTARHASAISATKAGAQHAHHAHTGTTHLTRHKAPAHSLAANSPRHAKPAAALPAPDHAVAAQTPAPQTDQPQPQPQPQPQAPAVDQPQALPPILH
jgi:hypothetical protein